MDEEEDLDFIQGEETGYVIVKGARVHNLQNIDVTIPRDKLTVITGLSGSGKSSLAFDTIYAEGQRRYIETFSAYARQFLGNMERPDVDLISGLSPVISIEQKTTNKNPRSTVGTITEIYDFLRLLFARASDAYSHLTGEKMVKYSDDQIIKLILENFDQKKTLILAPVVRSRKGHYKELFSQILKRGLTNVRIDGELVEIKPNMKVDRYKIHNIEIVIDKMVVGQGDVKRLHDAISLAMKNGKGICMVLDKDTEAVRFYSRRLMCPTTGISYDEPAPNSFSFNSPQGYCPTCKGLACITEVDHQLIFPDLEMSIAKGGIAPLGPYKNTLFFRQIEAIGLKYEFDLKTPIKDIPDEAIDIILNGSEETFKLLSQSSGNEFMMHFEGLIKFISMQQTEGASKTAQKWADQFSKLLVCPTCKGDRLKEESLQFKIDEQTVSQLARKDLGELRDWLVGLEDRMSERQVKIGREVLKEIRTRLGFLLNVGLDYLSLDRESRTLSGGESQRIRLATQIGSQLVNVLYILDEPSIGLHQRDNQKLIDSLQKLRDTGNSVIVVEHDKEMIEKADYVIDIGPGAGKHGGKVVAAGTPEEILKCDSLTAQYMNGMREIAIPAKRRKGNGQQLVLKGAKGNNLKNVSISLPLGTFICITGVSGSGKSTLINETLQPILSQAFYHSLQDPLAYESFTGIDLIDKVIEVDQTPIGRTPRSNAATYTDVFSDIRNLLARLPEAQIRAYKAGRFSFNVIGGRCETCKGGGMRVIEMNFLPDVYVLCEDCRGKRYNKETLEVRYKGKSISDILNMTIENALEFFEGIPQINLKLKALHSVGLGYITLGQPSTTLSGGESQRVKLASELAKKDTGKTVYILDEPTTGLHFDDIRVLLEVLNRLVDRGNTVIVIEHNLDVIKVADHIIDIGPEGGRGGGRVVAKGTPEEVAKVKESFTAQFLALELKQKKNKKINN